MNARSIFAIRERKDPDSPGGSLPIVAALHALAIAELVGGVVLFFTASKVVTVGNLVTGPVIKTTHDYSLGVAYLMGAVFVASLLFGFAHLIQDTHDIKRRLARDDSSAAPPARAVGVPEGDSHSISWMCPYCQTSQTTPSKPLPWTCRRCGLNISNPKVTED
jgi:hypothetical protein